MAQTALSSPPVLIPGMIPDLNEHQTASTQSVRSNEASATIRFGACVQIDEVDDDGSFGVINVATGADGTTIAGLAVWHKFVKASFDGDIAETDGDGYLPDVMFDIMTRGKLCVFVETDVAPGDEVHVRIDSTNPAATPPKYYGSFLNTKDTTHTLDISAFAKWKTAATAGTTGSVAILEFDFTNSALATADS